MSDGLAGGQPHLPAGDVPFERRFLPEFGDHLGGRVGEDEPAHHVLAAGPVAALDDGHAGAAVGQRVGRRQPGGAAADDDGVEASAGGFRSLKVERLASAGRVASRPALCAASSRCCSAARSAAVLALSDLGDQRRHDLEQVADDAEVGDVEDRARRGRC